MSHAFRARFPHQLAFLINNPLRRWLITPEVIADRLNVSATSRILEIGPGSGFFSGELARRTTDGRLELFDVQLEMLVRARANLFSKSADHIGFVAGDARHLPFAPQSFDRALLVAVLGEVQDPELCLRSVLNVLEPGGLVAVHEHWPDPDRIGPVELDRLAVAAGFNFVRRWGPAWNYTSLFQRPLKP